MNNAELFHRWANRVKDHGKSGNVFYEGETLYSYGHHFPLAVLTGKQHDGKEVVLVNSRSYSMTTAKHKSCAVRASSHLSHIYIPAPESPDHPSNLTYLNAETRNACEKLRKVRSGVDWAEGNARRAVDDAKLYRSKFLKGKGRVVPLPKDFDAILTAAREREERHRNPPPELLAKREKREATRRAAEIEAAQQKIAAWRAGEPVSLSWDLPCMLRLKGDDTCETSLRAEVPLTHARRLYGLILGVMAKGEDWETNGHTIPVGVYKVDRITKEGTLTAGCHTITFEEIDRFAGERGWR